MADNPTWAVNDWDKHGNPYGQRGLVMMLPKTFPLAKQLSFAESTKSHQEGLLAKYNAKGDKKTALIYAYKVKVTTEHIASLKQQMQPPAQKPTPTPPKPLDKEAIKTRAFGTEKEQEAAEKLENQKEAFDRGVKAVQDAKDAKDVVKQLRGPLKKGGGVIEMRDGGGFGDIQAIVRLAMAKTPKERYGQLLERREIYLRVNIANEAAAAIKKIDQHFPKSLWRQTDFPERGPFRWIDVHPKNKQTTFALLGGSIGEGVFRKIMTNGRFIRAGVSFCAETPDKKAHMDFSVGFNWEPNNNPAGVSVIVGQKPQEAYNKAQNNKEAEVTSGGLKVFVAINNQTVVIGIGRV